MKPTKNELWEQEANEKNAAREMLRQYIEQHSGDVAYALAEIIPFFFDCTYGGLRSAMSTVSVTFANLALDVIIARDDDGGDDSYGKLQLPVDADQMKSAIHYLSRFVELLGPLSMIADNSSEPAIKMCREAFSKYEIRG